MKKLLLMLLALSIYASTFSQALPPPSDEPQPDPDAVFIGWTYTNISETKTEGGTGKCFQESTAKYYLFWIRMETTVRYRYADCQTGAATGDWVETLLGT